MGLPDSVSFVLDQTNLEAYAATRDCNSWLCISCPLRNGVSRAALNAGILSNLFAPAVVWKDPDMPIRPFPQATSPQGGRLSGSVGFWSGDAGCITSQKDRLPYSDDANSMKPSVLAPLGYDPFKHVMIMQYRVIVTSLLGAQCLSGVPTMAYKQQDAYMHYSLWVELITTR